MNLDRHETEKIVAQQMAALQPATQSYRRDKDAMLKWILGLMATGLCALIIKHEVSLAVMASTMESMKESQHKIEKSQDESKQLLDKVAFKLLGKP
jgi:hypothetical protein